MFAKLKKSVEDVYSYEKKYIQTVIIIDFRIRILKSHTSWGEGVGKKQARNTHVSKDKNRNTSIGSF